MRPHCEERDRLLAQKDAAWRDYYANQNVPGKDIDFMVAQKKVHNLMQALTTHYVKHGCNLDDSDTGE